MATMATITTIPTIDISPYLNGTDKQSVASDINKACTEIGFFMIQGHGIPIDLLENVQKASTQFFDLPHSTKNETVAPFGLGYMGMGTENVAATLEENSQVKDYKESLNITLPVRDKVWPKDENLRNVCSKYYKAVETLATQLMRLFALALGQPESFFDDKVNTPYTTLRLLNYPEYEVKNNATVTSSGSNDDKADTRNAEHTDYGTLTVLWSSDSRGLQARSRDNEWIDVIAPPDQFIINIGDLMMNWTNDKWVSTLHRVVPHPETKGQRRMSIPFFHNPNTDAIVECIASCHDESNPPKYPPIKAIEHLEMKVSKALGKEEKLST